MNKTNELAVSLILASRNGEKKLANFFNGLDGDSVCAARAELLLVDSASTDGSAALMTEFAARAPFPIRVIHLEIPGQARAQNAAAAKALGALLAFTDDDCRLDPDYFKILARDFDLQRHHYGGGAVVLGDPADDPRMANTSSWHFTEPMQIPPRSLLPAGLLHGANLVFRKDVFHRLGCFDEASGPGEPLVASDAELVGRATALGFTGLLMPDLRVLHYPNRPRGSPDADAVVRTYDRGRGSYYASLLLMGEQRVWDLWRAGIWRPLDDPQTLSQLEREFRGAADYLVRRMESQARTSHEPKDQRPHQPD